MRAVGTETDAMRVARSQTHGCVALGWFLLATLRCVW